MTPSNPQPTTPNILKFEDNQGVQHAAVAVQHSHTIAEVDELQEIINKVVVGAGSPNNGIIVATTGGNLYRSNKSLGDLQDKLTFDSTPTVGSTNPVTSGGVKAALDEKQNTLTFDSTPTASSTNPVTSGGVKAALLNKTDLLDNYGDIIEVNEKKAFIAGIDAIKLAIGEISGRNWITLDENNWANLQRALTTPDSTPTSDSDNLVTSGGVKTALDGKTYLQDGGEGNISLQTDEENKSYAEIHANDYIQLGIAAASPENIQITPSNWANLQRALTTPDSTPTSASDKLITSGAVYSSQILTHFYIVKDSNGNYTPDSLYGYNYLTEFIQGAGAAYDRPVFIHLSDNNDDIGKVLGFVSFSISGDETGVTLSLSFGMSKFTIQGTMSAGDYSTLTWSTYFTRTDFTF